MIKVHFRYDNIDPALLLKTYSKMTPQRSGRWNELVGVLDPAEADYFVVLEGCAAIENHYPPEKILLIGSHHVGLPAYQCFDNRPCAAALDVAKTVGFCEWWIDRSYDELMALEPPEKTQELICIISNAERYPYQKWRKRLVHRICDRDDLQGRFDLYGRIKPKGEMKRYFRGELGRNTPTTYWFGKEPVYHNARYALELDGGPTSHYWSERFNDALLSWAMPLYWGGDNVHEYLPAECFRYIDIHGDGSDVLELAASNYREQHMDAIAEARQQILNHYQLWPTVERMIAGL